MCCAVKHSCLLAERLSSIEQESQTEQPLRLPGQLNAASQVRTLHREGSINQRGKIFVRTRQPARSRRPISDPSHEEVQSHFSASYLKAYFEGYELWNLRGGRRKSSELD
jgi:hypothetical protein